MNVLCEVAGSARVTYRSMKGASEADGDSYAADSPMVARGTDTAASEASKPVALLADIRALLGCTMEEVRNA